MPIPNRRPSRGSLVRRCAAAALAVCASLAGASCSDERVGVDLAVNHFDHVASSSGDLAHAPADRVSVAVVGAEVVVDGSFRLPDHCDELRAGVRHEGSQLEIRVRAAVSHSHHSCEDSDRAIIVGYTATVRNLPSDSYDLRVVYESHRRGASPRSAAVRRTLYREHVQIP